MVSEKPAMSNYSSIPGSALQFVTAGILNLLLLISPLSHSQVVIDETAIDALFSDWTADTPGGVVGVLRDGEAVYTKAFGLADMETGRLITLDSQLNIASVSKTFTAFAVLLLEERGLLSLDDDIRLYLPELPDFGETVTIYHLLHHFSGLRNWNTLMALKGRGEDDRIDHSEVFDVLRKQRELNHPPGHRETYSNSNYYLLARIVEEISGQSFREFTAEAIFAPLGMRHTSFADNLDETIPNLAWGHFSPGGQVFLRDMPAQNVVGSGNLITSLNDFLRWEKNLLSPTVGSTGLIEKLNMRGALNSGISSRFARGLGYSLLQGLPVQGMGGSTPGYRSTRSHYPELGITVVILANSAYNVSAPAIAIMQNCCADEIAAGEAELAIYSEKFVSLAETELADLSGAYRVHDSDDVLFTFANPAIDGLVVTGLEFVLRMRPVAQQRFASVSPINETVASYATTENGSMSLTIERQGIPFLTATRIDEIEPDTDYLRQFVGSFYSQELQRGFELIVREGALYRTADGLPERLLSGEYRDLFSAAGNTGLLLFERDERDQVTGFKLSVAGVNNLLYEKR